MTDDRDILLESLLILAEHALVLDIYSRDFAPQKPKVNPVAPSKAQMVSTATGTLNRGGTSQTMTLAEAKAENAKMEEERDKNPHLRYDEKWVAKRNQIKSELNKRIAELSQ